MRRLLSVGMVVWACATLSGQTTQPWTQLSQSTCGVDSYAKKYPDRDGRGVVIAVIDTGVDVAVPGLNKMPDGSPKVIDVQDFTGEGEIMLSPANLNAAGDKVILYDKDGAAQEYTPPPAGSRPKDAALWTGMIREKAFANTSVSDVNDNGSKDDEFAMLVVVPAGGGEDEALVYIDAAGERDWSKAKPLRNYHVAQEHLLFPRPAKEKQIPQLPVSVNVMPRQRKVVLHFDDGGHGTHVAGIAAGWKINGQDGFNGIAPGAKVISLKIGHGALSGGATTTGAKKRAFEYAAQYAREHNVPVVCNLSFGIASEREASSDIDTFLDKLLRENPNLVVCTSAGNNGPGLSSVGTPAAAHAVISAAALMAADTARDVWGVNIPGPVVTTFSSRGGDLGKPDIATPGWSASTVTTWNREGDFFSGTSMASPYAAGMAARLICDARAEIGAATTVRSSWLKAALQRSARPIDGFTPLDFGAGIPDMLKSAEALRAIVRDGSKDPIFDFHVETESPLMPGGKGPAAYWRSTYAPTDRPQTFTIKPVFAPTADAEVRRSYTKRFGVRSTADWCKAEQTQIYFRAEQGADVRVSYDASGLGDPGLHFAAIELLDGETVARRLWNTIIVPLRAGPAQRDRVELKDQKVRGWVPQRYFLAVPTGATAMHLELAGIDGRKSTASVRGVFRPNGNVIRTRSMAIDPQAGKMKATFDVTSELEPGIWEVDVTSRRPDEESYFVLAAWFDGITAAPAEIASWSEGPGKSATGSVTLTNAFDTPLPVTLSGAVEGLQKKTRIKLSPDADTGKVSLKFDAAMRAARIRFDLNETEYAMFTDVAVNVLDAKGKAIMKEGMSDRHFRGEVANPGGAAACELEIRAAFTYPDSEQKAEFEVTVDYLWAKPIPIDATRGDSPDCTLYPGVPTPIDFKLSSRTPKAAADLRYVGYIRAAARADGTTAVDVPLIVKP